MIASLKSRWQIPLSAVFVGLGVLVLALNVKGQVPPVPTIPCPPGFQCCGAQFALGGCSCYDPTVSTCCTGFVGHDYVWVTYPGPNQGCCGLVAYDPQIQGCCNGTPYDLTTMGCCGGTTVYSLTAQSCCCCGQVINYTAVVVPLNSGL